MKLTDKKKPINTIPKGVWESNRPIQNKDKDKTGAPSNEIKDEPRMRRRMRSRRFYECEG